ncbi:histidine phosphatase family protein [Ectobacillus polymachus]|uniref:histidine phosphatase family protein n=1 Tax=Ectobacillus polymachus TaxID=1508806 RepID=UPI003A87D240
MKISLIKHGRKEMTSDFMNARQFRKWLVQYNKKNILPEKNIPNDTVEAIRSAKIVLSSTATSAIQTATLLTDSLSFVQNPIFDETDLPFVIKVPQWVKLKPSGWITMSRTLWMAGFSNHIESYAQATHRAKQATDLLIGYALCYDRVALVGHDYFNTMIAKELRKRGWSGPMLVSYDYWDTATYEFPKALEGRKQGFGLTAT